MEIKQFWHNAISYSQYLREAGERLGNPRNQQDKAFANYYKLGVQRMNRMTEKYVPDSQQVQTLAQKKFDGKVLIISEAWCGDASQVIPVVVKFFEQFEIKITYRDQEPSLVDHYLVGGTRSIPVVIFLDDQLKELAHWGPRPKYGVELLNKHKTNPEKFTKDQFYVELQTYYSKNRGFDTIEELLELL